MLVLHAFWVSNTALALWGETTQPAPAKKQRNPKKNAARPHPFSAAENQLVEALPLPELKDLAESAKATLRLPTRGDAPVPSRPFLREEAATQGPLTLAEWEAHSLAFRPQEALWWLLNARPGPGLDFGPEVAFWQQAARLALDILTGGRYLPQVENTKEGCAARWRPLLHLAPDAETVTALARTMPPASRALWTGEGVELNPRALLEDFLNHTVDALARGSANFGLRRSQNRLTLAERWLDALTLPDAHFTAPADFFEQYQAWANPEVNQDANFRLCFRLDPPETTTDAGIVVPRANTRDWAVRYFLQAHDDPSLLVPAENVWQERGSLLKYLNRRFDQPQEKMLEGLGFASRLFAPIEDSLQVARPEATTLNATEAHTFIREIALLLQSSGFGVLLPGLSTKLGVRLKLQGKGGEQRKSAKTNNSTLTFERVVKFDWELALGDEPLSAAEFEKLSTLKVPLVQIRGQWVELRPELLQQALQFLEERAEGGTLPLAEAARLALNPQAVAGLPVTGVEAAGWVKDWLAQLTDNTQLKPLPAPTALQGTLRHYQSLGFAWLAFLREFGFGACLADDMGLGKTIQTIALLLHLKATESKPKPALLVCPTSVVSNWQRELAKFGPALRVQVHHGLAREKTNFAKVAAQHDVIITSYTLLHRDGALLKKVDWREVVLDEAQNIKNPDTKAAQAARALPAEHRIALTGTPVENRLTELWSIFQFLNPNYLGPQAEFNRTLARPIERLQDPDAAKQLKALTAPFILRRIKTDPTVIRDLPEKNEMKVFCSLTREQATLYQAVVKDAMKQIEESEGIQRRGLVLATLLKLKQVCNHPAQFLGEAQPLPERSGKLDRLGEMLAEVQAVDERALVFTQFTEMGDLLQAHLQETLGEEVLFLHGGVPAKKRTQQVARFQEDPRGPRIFLLSIKAGGTGLNLTRANHVFHFDRWWNPAVENQATDRAFRIGQTRNVQVHKFLCAGTVEERIDEMITRKAALADSIVGTSEAWITELNTAQLRELFTLREDVIAA